MGDVKADMDYFEWFSKIFSSLSGLGFLIGIILLWKTGLLEFILNLKKNGKNNAEHRIQDLEKHAEVANAEMKEVKESLVRIETKTDIILKHLKL